MTSQVNLRLIHRSTAVFALPSCHHPTTSHQKYTTSSKKCPSLPSNVRLTQKYQIPHIGTIKISLQSQSALGVAQSRGERSYQEDYFTVASLNLKQSELNKTIQRAQDYQRLIGNQNIQKKRQQRKTGDQKGCGHQPDFQSLFVGVIDGHGGSDSAEYLSKHFPSFVEHSEAFEIPNVIRKYRLVGGYFRRFRGGYLENIAEEVYALNKENKMEPVMMGIDERLSLGFLLADQQLMDSFPKSGTVTTVVLLTPLPIQSEDPSSSSAVIYPYFSSPLLSLVVGHVGDTSGLLCSAADGKVVALTENHHPDSHVESERLRRIGTGLITDSFGESRWGGSLANSRGLGDASFKGLGVTGEPDIVNKIIKGDEWQFLILVSDGISNMITNQEIVDLCKGHKTPTEAAEKVVKFAESLGGRDNMTALVIPLAGWKKSNKQDYTLNRREFRLRQSTGSTRQKRM